MGDEEDGVNRLEGLSDMTGGLIIRKRKSDEKKVPGKSLLGLDVLSQTRVRVERKRNAVEESPGGLSSSIRRHITESVMNLVG